MPLQKDIDIAYLAENFELSGASIKNIALNAAFIAASRQENTGMEHIMTALQQEPEEWVTDLYTGTAGDKWYAFLNLYQGMVYVMLLFYFVILLKEKDHIFYFLPALLLLGGFCFSMIWEAKSRYVYPYIVMSLPCVAWSLVYCAGKITGGIKKWRKKPLS